MNIAFKPLLALFVFCSGAVPSYSSHSQNTKFISLSRSLQLYFIFTYEVLFDKIKLEVVI
nr:MAG TPA: hypothetical protein [Caudoviricetes sp.]